MTLKNGLKERSENLPKTQVCHTYYTYELEVARFDKVIQGCNPGMFLGKTTPMGGHNLPSLVQIGLHK